jgi:hypothetical protein
MKTLFILLLFRCDPSSNENIIHFRELYANAVADERIAQQLVRETNISASSNLTMGYHGAAKIIMAKHLVNPFSKWNSFRSGRAILESAINADLSDAELRYLRLTIQENVPSFLGYKSNIRDDRSFLLGILTDLKDSHLKEIIQNYLKHSING